MVNIPMSLPLDKDGFLRRECPNCNKQFKWLPTEAETGEETNVEYYCPYCGKLSGSDSWWTKDQIDYAEHLAVSEVVEPELKKFARGLENLNRPGAPIKFKAEHKTSSKPQQLKEPDDMRKVAPPCHPSEPLKIYEDWEGPVTCLICGKQFPI